KEKIIRRDGRYYVRIPGVKRGQSDFHAVRTEEPTYVIANEVEPLEGFVELVRKITSLHRKELSHRIRKLFFEEDQRIFDEDYAKFKSEETHPRDIGRPFLITPEKPRAGIVLVHGYLAAPQEIRALADYLVNQGYAVYGVRLKGHGTAPEDLAQVRWEDWYTSFNRGYVVIKSLTDKVILGGFSTGGLLALMGAGLKRDKVHAVFSINAPRRLRQYTARFASTVVSMNSLLRKIRRGRESWDFVANNPENAHINYKRNPIAGVVQLEAIMKATSQHLPNIVAPTLIVQASNDPVVHGDSGAELFTRVGTPYKELLVVERERHGIINGEGAEDIFERVNHFLTWAGRHAPEPQMPEPAFHGEVPRPMFPRKVEEAREQTA
ncbi:MAG: alpha/beta fold hydrolase, partial [Candidatus Hydrogenedentales bacterium]